MHNNKYVRDDHRFDTYIEMLVKQGAIIHQSLSPAIFSLNNGLQYPGLKVKQKLNGENILVVIPVQLLLTAHKAFQQKELKQVFEQSFYLKGAIGQGRIMVTYLLFIFHTRPQQIWSQMVKHFDKQIDILSFWSEQELNKFADKSVLHAKKIDLDYFEQQWKQFQQVQNNHQALQSQIFTLQNYKWIYIHVVSRCFGSLMNSVYMTPFCQFFNHHCVNVSYTCLTKEDYQKQKNKNKEQGTEKLVEDDLISFSSNNSVDYLQQGDFNYWEVDTYQIKWGSKISFDLKQKETKLVETKVKQLMQLLQRELVWSGYNLIFIGQIVQKINIIKNQYMAGRRKANETNLQLQKTRQNVQNYKKQVTEYYRRTGFNYRPKTQKTNNYSTQGNLIQTYKQSTSVENKQPMPPSKQFKYFRMGSGKYANFQADQQIYFCYGNVSNRYMLIRYGCCIEQNHHEHVWVKFFMGKDFSPYPDLLNLITQKGLPITYKVKLKPYIFAFQPVLLMKMRKWRLTHDSIHDIFYITDLNIQIEAFQNLKPIYQEQVKKYFYEEDLTDKTIGYHQYFTRVYHNEKRKILQLQIELLNFLIQKFNQMKKQKKVLDLDEKYQKYLKYYWKGLKGMIW